MIFSGEDPYRALLLPLTKALAAYTREFGASRGDEYDTPRDYRVPVALAVAVIDAPMIFAGHPSQVAPEPIDWVRLIVRQPTTWTRTQHGPFMVRGGFAIVDAVHRSFFDGFLNHELLPFAQTVMNRFASLNDALTGGRLILPAIAEPWPAAIFAEAVEAAVALTPSDPADVDPHGD